MAGGAHIPEVSACSRSLLTPIGFQVEAALDPRGTLGGGALLSPQGALAPVTSSPPHLHF